MSNNSRKNDQSPFTGLNDTYTISEEISRGNDGRIYKIKVYPELVVKQFYRPSAEKTAKIRAMIANPPDDLTRQYRHISLAWPIKPLTDLPNGNPLPAKSSSSLAVYNGFFMPYIDRSETFSLLTLYNPQDRRETRLNFTWEYLLRIALNLASIVTELHRKGYVIGDLNENNFLVTKQALVTLIDCDSIQVPPYREWKQPFLCIVGKPEYTPPELQDSDFSKVVRTPNHDNFGLAVLIFLTLMEGCHPFSAVWKGQGMAPSLEENIQQGKFPYTDKNLQFRPKYAPPLEFLPPRVQRLMKQCFVDHHKPLFPWLKRPSARQWRDALIEATTHLSYCKVNPSHVYSDHLLRCPWCERIAMGLPDPFPRVLTSPGPPPNLQKQP